MLCYLMQCHSEVLKCGWSAHEYWIKCPEAHLGWKCPEPRTRLRWRCPEGRQCSRSETPGLRWPRWAGQSQWWTPRNRPSRSSTPWAERTRTEPSRTLSGSAWRNHSRTGDAPLDPHLHHRLHHLRMTHTIKDLNKHILDNFTSAVINTTNHQMTVSHHLLYMHLHTHTTLYPSIKTIFYMFHHNKINIVWL